MIFSIWTLQCKLIYNNKIMNDEEDQFFVEPEIQEVHDIKIIEQPNDITDKVVEESKIVPLKMLEIPKTQQSFTYRPFKFQHHQSSDEQEEQLFPNMDDSQSPFLQCYTRQQCIYRRHHNELYNKVNDCTYYSGSFLHRNIFLEGNYSDTFEIENVVKNYYQTLKNQLYTRQQDDIIFDSHFQSGNLFAAFKIGPYEYDLVMSNDINSIGNNQWFYFSVENMIPDRDYTFSVVNFTKSDSLFNYGMAPAIYSLAENNYIFDTEKGWKRQGRDISYKKGTIPRQNSRRMYYKLSFKIRTLYEKDKIYIAHTYPYTNEKLNRYLDDKVIKNKENLTKVTIGKTLSKRNIQGLKISLPLGKKKDTRKAIIVMARQHPGQTQGSYVCQGVIDKFLGKAKQSQFLLKNFIIYVIPMVNPDGVAFGHYRTNLSGKDLNRKWNATDKDLNCPEVSTIKAFIQQISKQREIRFILDLHGHSKKLNSFFYGNPCQQNPDSVRIFPYVCSKLHPGVQYLDCTFSCEEYKRKAARVYLSYLYRLIHVYTFQSSFYAYFKDGKKIEFSPKEYRQLGGALVNALSMQLDHEVRFQQSFEFNLKKYNTKQFLTSPFVKLLSELKNNKELLDQGCQQSSGSQSKPQEMEVNIQEMQGFKPARPSSTPNAQQAHASKTMNISRRGRRDPKQFNFNKPIRNIKFLEISRVNSILPDKYQLGLQPIKKKQLATQIVKPLTSFGKVSVEVQTNPKNELRLVSFKKSQIQTCLLSSSVKLDMLQQRKYSSLIRSNNRNIIFKFDMFGQTTTRQQDYLQKQSVRFKHAYSQTMITYSKQQGEKIKSSQVITSAETPQRDEKRWARNNSIRVESSIKNSVRRDPDFLFNGMVKKLLTQKQALKNEQYSNKFILDKPLSIKKKQISKK